MHNVKRFLQDAVFEPSQEARARAAAEGNTRPEDMIPIYRKRTTIDPSGRETETQARYVPSQNTTYRRIHPTIATSLSTERRRWPNSVPMRGTA